MSPLEGQSFDPRHPGVRGGGSIRSHRDPRSTSSLPAVKTTATGQRFLEGFEAARALRRGPRPVTDRTPRTPVASSSRTATRAKSPSSPGRSNLTTATQYRPSTVSGPLCFRPISVLLNSTMVQRSQKPLRATSCGFESRSRHQYNPGAFLKGTSRGSLNSKTGRNGPVFAFSGARTAGARGESRRCQSAGTNRNTVEVFENRCACPEPPWEGSEAVCRPRRPPLAKIETELRRHEGHGLFLTRPWPRGSRLSSVRGGAVGLELTANRAEAVAGWPPQAISRTDPMSSPGPEQAGGRSLGHR